MRHLKLISRNRNSALMGLSFGRPSPCWFWRRIVIGILSVSQRSSIDRLRPSPRVSPDPLLTQNTSSPTDDSQVPTRPSSTATEANRPNVNANTSETRAPSSPQLMRKSQLTLAARNCGRLILFCFHPTAEHCRDEPTPATDYGRYSRSEKLIPKAQLLESLSPHIRIQRARITWQEQLFYAWFFRRMVQSAASRRP